MHVINDFYSLIMTFSFINLGNMASRARRPLFSLASRKRFGFGMGGNGVWEGIAATAGARMIVAFEPRAGPMFHKKRSRRFLSSYSAKAEVGISGAEILGSASLQDLFYTAQLGYVLDEYEGLSPSSKEKVQQWAKDAFVHPSFPTDQKTRDRDGFNRIEFIGDAVVHLLITRTLNAVQPPLNVASLNNIRSQIQSNSMHRTIAQDVGLLNVVKFGTQVNQVENTKVVADCFEALVGFLYLLLEEAGRDPVLCLEEWLQPFWNPHVEKILFTPGENNWKTALQIWAQKTKGGAIPRYETIAGDDVPGSPNRFEASVSVLGSFLAKGRGPSKVEAEKAAAKMAVEEAMGTMLDVTPLFPRTRPSGAKPLKHQRTASSSSGKRR